MNEDKIYPSMVIRSQAEAIELLEKENQQLKEMIDKEDGCNHRRKQIFELKDKLAKALKENTKLKSTLAEIREYIKETLELKEEYPEEVECVVNDLLQIIDKGVK